MREHLLWGATGLGLVSLFVALALWDPASAGGADFCLVHRVTGIACPGCGLTRAAAALAQGRFAESVRWHPLFGLLAAESALFWLGWGMALHRGRTSGTLQATPLTAETLERRSTPPCAEMTALRRIAPKVALATGVLLILVWIVRLTTGTLPA